jgi:hypothetical protein
MRRRRQQRQHPYDEKVVRNHAFHLRQTDTLQANSGNDLLIGEREQQFTEDLGFVFTTQFVENDDGAQNNREAGSDYEGEEDLKGIRDLNNK